MLQCIPIEIRLSGHSISHRIPYSMGTQISLPHLKSWPMGAINKNNLILKNK